MGEEWWESREIIFWETDSEQEQRNSTQATEVAWFPWGSHSHTHPGLAPGQAKGETGTSNPGKTLLGERSVARSVRARQMTWPRGIKWTSPSGPPVLLPQQQSCPEEKGASGHTLPLAHWEAKDIENIVPIHGELNGFKNFLYKDPRFVWRVFRWNYFAILLLQFLSAAKVSLKICRPDQGRSLISNCPTASSGFWDKIQTLQRGTSGAPNCVSPCICHHLPHPPLPTSAPSFPLLSEHTTQQACAQAACLPGISFVTFHSDESHIHGEPLFFLSLCPYLLFIWLPFPWTKVLIFMLL